MVKKDEIKVMFCPKCKSVDVKYVFGLGNLFGVVPRMKCGNCGFTSVGFNCPSWKKGALSHDICLQIMKTTVLSSKP